MAPPQDLVAPPPSDWESPKITLGRKPDFSLFTVVDLLPTITPTTTTTVSLPTYPALPTVEWASDASSSSSEAMSSQSTFTTTTKKPWRQPAAGETSISDFKAIKGHKGISATIVGAVAAVSILACLFVLAGICLICCRRSRKRRQAAIRAGATAEMAQTRSNGSNNQYAETRAYIRPPSTEPPPSLTLASTLTGSSTQNLARPEPPVLLSTTINQSYYTGIDTSDGLSLVESRTPSLGAPAYAASITEPPPPYRPRNVMSRDGSMRLSVAPPSYGPRLSVRSTNMAAVRSPFEDPEEGSSPVSEMTPSPTIETSQVRDMEEMSDVSELSYQQDPAVPHPTV